VKRNTLANTNNKFRQNQVQSSVEMHEIPGDAGGREQIQRLMLNARRPEAQVRPIERRRLGHRADEKSLA
jgi:hypothetical protein